MKAVWLAPVLRAAGCRVVEVPGWQTRGKEMTGIQAVIYHGTVTGPSSSPLGVAHLLRDGRVNLAGPLSQVGYDGRNDVWYVVAAGRSNHNGYGRFGNDTIGVEEYNWNGYLGRFETYNIKGASKGIAAILRRANRGADRVLGHFESDPGRKSDPVRTDMNQVRALVQGHLSGASTPTEGDDDMYSDKDRSRDNATAMLVADISREVNRSEKNADGSDPSLLLKIDRLTKMVERIDADPNLPTVQ